MLVKANPPKLLDDMQTALAHAPTEAERRTAAATVDYGRQDRAAVAADQ
jgi:hypothetical protein